ncbi:MAG: ORF6N domain-containing protein, partial [Chitinophagales bacterium]
MLDFDLSELYEIETRVLNQAVKRNINRFPQDFMFQLNEIEFTNLKSQFVTSRWGGTRKLPFAFTEQGVAMLSSVLHSSKAIEVNISIM